MTDIIDQAAERAELWLRDALRAQARRAKPLHGSGQESREECEDCGEAIAPARRQALPGARRCVFCQQAAEKEGLA